MIIGLIFMQLNNINNMSDYIMSTEWDAWYQYRIGAFDPDYDTTFGLGPGNRYITERKSSIYGLNGNPFGAESNQLIEVYPDNTTDHFYVDVLKSDENSMLDTFNIRNDGRLFIRVFLADNGYNFSGSEYFNRYSMLDNYVFEGADEGFQYGYIDSVFLGDNYPSLDSRFGDEFIINRSDPSYVQLDLRTFTIYSRNTNSSPIYGGVFYDTHSLIMNKYFSNLINASGHIVGLGVILFSTDDSGSRMRKFMIRYGNGHNELTGLMQDLTINLGGPISNFSAELSSDEYGVPWYITHANMSENNPGFISDTKTPTARYLTYRDIVTQVDQGSSFTWKIYENKRI